MFFRRFSFNLFYISVYRLFFFIILIFFLVVDLNSNIFICSYLNSLLVVLNLKLLLNNLLILIISLLLFKFYFTKSRNLINYVLIDAYLLFSFLFKNISKYLIFFNTHYSFSFIYNLFYYFKNNIILNSKIYYIYVYILNNLVTRNFNWFPLYKKISYYGYFRSSRFNNSHSYEKSIYTLKN